MGNGCDLNKPFNKSNFSYVYKAVWKISSVVSIPKVYSLIEKFDYHSISILPVLAKAFENVIYEQMVNYFSRGLISSFQSGFRPGYSTATAIARVSDDMKAEENAF
jgi:hypothetical protein